MEQSMCGISTSAIQKLVNINSYTPHIICVGVLYALHMWVCYTHENTVLRKLKKMTFIVTIFQLSHTSHNLSWFSGNQFLTDKIISGLLQGIISRPQCWTTEKRLRKIHNHCTMETSIGSRSSIYFPYIMIRRKIINKFNQKTSKNILICWCPAHCLSTLISDRIESMIEGSEVRSMIFTAYSFVPDLSKQCLTVLLTPLKYNIVH